MKTNRFLQFHLRGLVSALTLLVATLLISVSASAQAPAWPADDEWIWFANDSEEGGVHNDQRDVESLYYTVRGGYLFLRMKNRGAAG